MPIRRLSGNSSDLIKVVLPAAARGDLATVRSVVSANWAWLHAEGPHNRSMLWEAAYKQRRETIDYLVEQGADVNLAGTYYTPLYVELTPYTLARRSDNDDLAAYFARQGAGFDIHSAAYLGDISTVRRYLKREPRLLDQGYPSTVRQPVDPSFAAFELPQWLQKKVATVEQRIQSILREELDAARCVLRDTRVRQWDRTKAWNGWGAKYRDALVPLIDLVREISCGSRRCRHPNWVRARLLWVRRHWLDLWYEQVRNVDRDGYGGTPLHYAVAGGQSAMVDYLIERGAKLSAYGPSVLKVAEGELHERLRDRISRDSAGLAAIVTPEWGDNPELTELAERHRVAIPKWDAELSDRCSGNMNATDDPERVLGLLEKGADVNTRVRLKRTPLHRAAQAGFLKITTLLVERGADLEADDDRGQTPLFYAVQHGRIETVRLLLRLGANPKARSRSGRDLVMVAQRSRKAGAKEILKLLAGITRTGRRARA